MRGLFVGEATAGMLSYLTTSAHLVTIITMKAVLLLHDKIVFSETELIEMVVWRVPKPVEPSNHGFKYRLVYVVNGRRIVGYDNERGKGDHCHLEHLEVPYSFTDVDRLIEDFLYQVRKRRKTP